MSLWQPPAFLRVPRGRLVFLLTTFARLSAGESKRGGPRATKHKRLLLYAATFRWRRANPCSRAAMMPEIAIHRKAADEPPAQPVSHAIHGL